MKRVGWLGWLGWIVLTVFLAGGERAGAHVGSPHVVFTGKAGNVPVQVIIRQPDVVPGLADISVRALTAAPQRVTVLPMHWSTDKSGAPRPDVAVPVPGETNLFSAALWFMARGPYGVEVQVEGPGGGSVIVPVNSIAYERKPMPPGLTAVLAGLGILLAAGVVGIAAAAAREATLPRGTAPGRSRRIGSVVAGVAALFGVGFALYGGSIWWRMEDTRHERRILYRQLAHTVAADGGSELNLQITDSRRSDPPYRLTPDHGKLIHQFLVGEANDDGLPVFAHLHPVRTGAHDFTAALPPSLPAGRYHVFTDLTHESGYTQTLTNTLVLTAAPVGSPPTDPDDSLSPAGLNLGNPVTLTSNLVMTLLPVQARAGELTVLNVRVHRPDGSPVELQPYLRMLGHAAVMRAGGEVFAHIHPAGTLSMAAARTFAAKLTGEAGAQASDANCGDLEAVPPGVAAALGKGGEVSFPYVFPREGTYFVWIQVKVDGRIQTGGFRVPVSGARLARR